MSGPQPYSHDERLTRAQAIAAQFQAKFDVLAIGIYGSLARGTDGPYSDIEMYCVVRGKGIDQSYEWSAGPWKAEVDVQSQDVLLAWAAEFDERWSLTHGSLVHILPLYDPEHILPCLKEKVFDHSQAEFDENIASTLVGEVYEFIGKIRNGVATGQTANLPMLAVELTKVGAFVTGLANKALYTSSAVMFAESLALPDRPDGFEALCKMVTSGGLSDPAAIARAADQFWAGVEAWATIKGLSIRHDLGELLP